jgi:hypothetical protein
MITSYSSYRSEEQSSEVMTGQGLQPGEKLGPGRFSVPASGSPIRRRRRAGLKTPVLALIALGETGEDADLLNPQA